jgi:N-(5-amino-5-carboxypentanoyl)-L-cysteinyl-D-valine synthase
MASNGKDVFDYRTVRSLHDNVLSAENKKRGARYSRTEQGHLTGEVPLLPIQKWFLDKPLGNKNYWNHTFSIGTPELDAIKLGVAIRHLQDYHDAFRINISRKNGANSQSFVAGYKYVDLTVVDVQTAHDNCGIRDLLRQLESGLNVENGPLFAVAYIPQFKDRSARIWFSIHHIIVDTVSWQILAQDLRLLYNGGDLGPKGSSLRQWQNLRAQVVQSSKGGSLATKRQHLSCSLSHEQTAMFLDQACGVFSTSERELIVTALGSSLQQLRGSQFSVVTIESHGREECVDPCLDVSRTLGWFTSMYPFKIPPITDLSQGIRDVKAQFASVPNSGIGYGPIFGYVESPMPAVSFNYLGRMGSTTTSDRGDWSLSFKDEDSGLVTAPEDANKVLQPLISPRLVRTAVCTSMWIAIGSTRIANSSCW